MSQGRTNPNSLKFTPKRIHNKISIDPGQLKSYFQTHTLLECATHFGCSKTTIKRKLQALGVDTSIHNHSALAKKKSRESSSKPKPTKEKLENLYIEQNLDSKTIAESYGVHYNTVRSWIKSYGLTKSRQDHSRSMMGRHFRKTGYSHPAQRPDVIKKTRKSSQKCNYIDKKRRSHTFKSLHELSYALWLDKIGAEWYYEETRIPYVDNMTGKWRIYVIDFTVIGKNKTRWIEVKPNDRMIPVDKRIYAARRAEDCGVLFRGNTDKERDRSWNLLLSGYREDQISFHHPNPRSNAKQVSYYFKSKEEAQNFSLSGWKYHQLVVHSSNLCALKLRKQNAD